MASGNGCSFIFFYIIISILLFQFSSVTQLCLTLCDPSKWWTWPFSWRDFQAKCGRCSLVPPSAYSEMQEERVCSDMSRSWGLSATPEAQKRPGRIWEPSESTALSTFRVWTPKLLPNKCLCFQFVVIWWSSSRNLLDHHSLFLYLFSCLLFVSLTDPHIPLLLYRVWLV